MTQKTQEQTDRAYELLDFLIEHQDAHDQNYWFLPGPAMNITDYVSGRLSTPITAATVLNECGTTACAAGWACLLAGDRVLSAATVEVEQRYELTIPLRAGELLGLNGPEAIDLFYEAKTLAEVKDTIEQIYGPRRQP